MSLQVETPSRIWRRIQECEARNGDMPSLPSLPMFDDSGLHDASLSLSSLSDDAATNAEASASNRPVKALLMASTPEPSQECIQEAISYGARSRITSQSYKSSVTPVASTAVTSLVQQENIENDGRTLPNGRSTLPWPFRPISGQEQEFAVSGNGSHRTCDESSLVLSKWPDNDCLPESQRGSYSGRSAGQSLPEELVASTAYNTSESGNSSMEIVDYTHDHRNTSDSKSDLEALTNRQGVPSMDSNAINDPNSPSVMVSPEAAKFTVSERHSLTTPASQFSDIHEGEDISTPHPRRRSFLLSIVNSTSRPRLPQPTPHLLPPKAKETYFYGTAESASHLRTAKTRLSHPLPVRTLEPITPKPNLGSVVETEPQQPGNTSFISTASSHDLTVYHRVNASFDPTTGAQGIGRFNAGKLNSYLHGLNRRLQEENELLLNSLKDQQRTIDEMRRNRQQELSEVMEIDGAEQWMQEKEEMERAIDGLKTSLERAEGDLRKELIERQREKDRWKERLTEVEKGVGDIIKGLEKRAAEAEQRVETMETTEARLRDTESRLSATQRECQLLKEQVGRAEEATTKAHKLERCPANAYKQGDSSVHDLQATTSQVQVAEHALRLSETQVVDLENQLRSLELGLRECNLSRDTLQDSLTSALEEIHILNKTTEHLGHELEESRASLSKATSERQALDDAMETLKRQLCAAQDNRDETHLALQKSNVQLTHTAEKLMQAQLDIQDLDDALRDSRRTNGAVKNELAELRSELAYYQGQACNPAICGQKKTFDADTAMLEAALLEANREIGRLTALLHQDRHRDVVKDDGGASIEIQPRQGGGALYAKHFNGNASGTETPLKANSGISSMRLANLSLKQPRTPGNPLIDLSWLADTTGEASAARLLREIERLQEELDFANESIDDKLGKLEEAGLDVVGLSKALGSARRRISSLEKELNLLHCKDEVDGKYTGLLNSFGRRLHQRDSQDNEVEDLRMIISSQADEMKRLCCDNTRSNEHRREKHTLASKLASEIGCIQSEADQLGHDLQDLRADRDGLLSHYKRNLAKFEQSEKQDRTQLALFKEQLNNQSGKKGLCATESQDALLALSTRHKVECKGLFVQIRYLKAKYNREAEFRSDLAHQKHYVLVLLSRLQKSERQILAFISQVERPVEAVLTVRPKRLKVVVFAIIFIRRAQRASDSWLQQRLIRIAIESALEDVRKSRKSKP